MNESSNALDTLKVLILEDMPADAKIMERGVSKVNENYEVRIVKSHDDFEHQLVHFQPHLILADYWVPGFDGKEALAMAREYVPDTPFVFVTGTLDDEELAAQTILSGASEFVLKNNLERLPQVIRSLLQRPVPQTVQVDKLRNELDQFRNVIQQYQEQIEQYKAELDKCKKYKRFTK